jgi:sulfur-carrier protein adenylyltransferase/sulfurtransferase
MKPRIVLAAVLVPLALIIAAVPSNTTRPYKLTAKQLLEEAVTKSQFVSCDMVADMLVNKDPVLQLIDVRGQDEFERYHLPGAINIPFTDLLSPQWEEVLHQDQKTNVFYSNGTVTANQAWMITRQLGYINNFVMEGGLNRWTETILHPDAPAETSADDEFARYDFRKAAGAALGASGSLTEDSLQTKTSPIKPPVPGKIPKKKKVQGGC